MPKNKDWVWGWGMVQEDCDEGAVRLKVLETEKSSSGWGNRQKENCI